MYMNEKIKEKKSIKFKATYKQKKNLNAYAVFSE